MLSVAASTWNELLQASDADCLFLTWEWIDTWWKYLQASRKMAILTAHQGTDLVGLAPLCVNPRDFALGRVLPEAEFLGSGFAGSDYLDFIVRKGCEGRACELLSEQLMAKEWSFRWNNVRHDKSSADGIARRLSHNGWSVARTIVNACPFIPLSQDTWESYLANLGSEHRYSFNRKWRRLHRDFSVRFEGVLTRDDCGAALETLLHLHNLRWQGRNLSDAFHTPELVMFHREFAHLAFERGWLRLFILSLNERPAAALYGFFYRRKFYFYQSGFDPAYEKYSVGLIAMGLAIQSAIEEGAEEYDLLHGDEAYKRHWARLSHPLSRLELYPPGTFGRIQESTKALARSARGVLRRAAESTARGSAV